MERPITGSLIQRDVHDDSGADTDAPIEHREVSVDESSVRVMAGIRKIGQSYWPFLLLLALLSIPALYPLLTEGFPKTHDASVHLIRLHLLDEQMRAGNYFPRWLPDLMTGHGYPTFNFYAPMIYIIAEVLHLAGAPPAYALTIMMGLLVLLAGSGMFFLASDLYRFDPEQGRLAGLAAGVVYIYTPYLLVNLYVRGALAELLAQALLPWLFWCVTRIFTTSTPTRYTVGAAMLLGVVALGHNITLLLLPLFLAPYLVVLLVVVPLDRAEQIQRVRHFVAWSLVAAAVTAFFWLPLIAERGLLSDLAFNAPHIEEHVWSLATFLEPNFPYDYPVSSIPFRLGLAQVILALAGLMLTRLRSALWWFWVALGAVALVGVTPAILPLWRNVELLGIVQFPWRLLMVVSISTALVTGGIITRARRQVWQAALTIGVIALAMAGGRPVIATFNTSMYADIAIDPAVIARYEAGYGAWGAGWHREFLPQWAEQFDALPIESTVEGAIPEALTLQSVTPTGLRLSVDSDHPSTLRMSQFYFPGWQATLDQVTPLAVYPSTQQGLVTVDLPAGAHTVDVRWAESWVENAAEWLSILSLLLLGAALIIWRRWRAAALALAAALLVGVVLKSPLQEQPEPFAAIQAEVLPGLTLLGYQTETSTNGRGMLITPYWYYRGDFERMSVAWRLVDDEGVVVSQLSEEPYHGTQPVARWQPGTVLRDGYRLPLPTGVPAGDYQLELRIDAKTDKTEWLPVGVVSASEVPTPHPVDILFTDPQSREQVVLAGYTLAVNDVEHDLGSADPATARPGDLVTIRLFWRAQSELSEDYHSFLHLVSHDRQTLAALDKIPGQEIARPRFWDRAYAEADTYHLRIPQDASSGLHYPRVGFYDYDDLDRFLLTIDGVEDDAIDLAPIKIVAEQKAAPQHMLNVAYGDFGELLGYTVSPDTTMLQPGATFTVTLFYRGLQPADRAFTQFFQLHSPDRGMAAQMDQPPLRGGNPTSTWQAGETIIEQVTLTVDTASLPGVYTLKTGMYDPVNGERAPIFATDGAPLLDQAVVLGEFTIGQPSP